MSLEIKVHCYDLNDLKDIVI